MGKRFREVLIRTAKSPIDIQSKQLLTVFENWKNMHEQVDDVCVMGVKVEQ